MSVSKSESSSVNDNDSLSMRCSRRAGHSGSIENLNNTEMSNKMNVLINKREI